MKILAKIIRIMTMPPVPAAMLAFVLFFYGHDDFGGLTQLIGMLIFLTALPCLAYPCQPLIPGFKKRGREGQRSLAFYTSAAGYLGGLIYALVSSAPKDVLIIYCTYILSVLLLFAFNKLTRWKASGHACGIAGPLAAMVWFAGPAALLVCALFAAMMWASMKNKNHTASELLLGACDSVAAFMIVLGVSSLISL